MGAGTSAVDYDIKVFINCPFDDFYLPLFRATIFAVYSCGFIPKSSLNENNGLDNRIDKITRLIEHCRYGIHDISRTELNAAELPRFNMPFELGLFYGARRYGNKHQKKKIALILERVKYSYQKFLSDINGIDIQAHENDPYIIIRHIRDWLNTNAGGRIIPGANMVWANYLLFQKQLPELSFAFGYSHANYIPFNDYCNLVMAWLIGTRA
jgi:hypothetical protein